MSDRTFTEISIPVEYGHISAKDWGSTTGRPILAIHGWQDNAGTFDTLIPWLDPTLRIVAMDLPGHGLSTHKPPGALYHYVEYLSDMKKVIEHLEWSKFTLIGHSMGGGLCMMYASLFPDNVQCVVSLDMVKPFTTPPADLIKSTVASINQTLVHYKTYKEPQVYNYEEALNILMKSTAGSLTKASAIVMLKRGAKPSENGKGIIYSRDIRLQLESLQKFDDHTCRTYLSGLKTNLLVLKAKNGFNRETPAVIQSYKDMFTRNCQKYLYSEVDGTHHVHMNNPAVLAPMINSFLSTC